jgi:hypothetical protein
MVSTSRFGLYEVEKTKICAEHLELHLSLTEVAASLPSPPPHPIFGPALRAPILPSPLVAVRLSGPISRRNHTCNVVGPYPVTDPVGSETFRRIRIRRKSFRVRIRIDGLKSNTQK